MDVNGSKIPEQYIYLNRRAHESNKPDTQVPCKKENVNRFATNCLDQVDIFPQGGVLYQKVLFTHIYVKISRQIKSNNKMNASYALGLNIPKCWLT